MRHLLLSYHTSPDEQPGRDLAGGMNVLLSGYLTNTRVETDVVVRSLTSEYQCLELTPQVRLHRLPCGASLPWTREQAWECLPAFARALQLWQKHRQFEVATAHYWMSAVLLSELGLPGGIMFHTLQAQKGAPHSPLEQLRLDWESRLIGQYPTAYLHWHDLNHARQLYPQLRGTVLRPGLALQGRPAVGPGHRPEGLPGPPWVYGWAARNDPIKNLQRALSWLSEQTPGSRLRVAGMHGPSNSQVEYLGPVDHQHMVDFYGSIHQLLNWSDYETYGLSILEALACGAAVGVRPESDWARRLRHLGLPWQPGAHFSEQDRLKAQALARAHDWSRVLARWDGWLHRLVRLARK